MNVLLINGSPHKTGCTYTALTEVAKALQADGIETEIFHIGAAPVGGCVGCGGCAKAGKCVFGGPVADVLPLVQKADGLVFGAPVHYATAAGSMLGFLHRLAMSGGQYLRHKPAAVVTSARRAGTPPRWKRWKRCRSSLRCLSSARPTGRWCTAATPSRRRWMKKAARSCATSAAIWRGSCAASSRRGRRHHGPAGRK